MSIIRNISAKIPRPLLLHIKYVKQGIYQKVHNQKKVDSNYDILTIREKNTHVFFGYYDVTPFNVHTDEFIFLNLKKGATHIDIMLSNLKEPSKRRVISSSFSWNWQQGVRLRWMPNNSREICYNDYNNQQYIAKILNVDSKSERIISKPLYDISKDGKWGLSLNFERLGVMRPGYGYTCRPYVSDDFNLNSEGIDLINLETNGCERILTYEDIAKVAGTSETSFSDNYINHISYSPSGRRFLFFWLTKMRGLHKADLLVYDLKDKSLKLLEKQDIVSHYVWIDDGKILCTAIKPNHKCYYYIYDVDARTKTIVNPSFLNEDGHPSILDSNMILSDTYPDLNGFQRLFLANLSKDGYKLLLKIYSNCLIEGEKRTDLHPRLNATKNIICFDSNHEFFRTLNFLYI